MPDTNDIVMIDEILSRNNTVVRDFILGDDITIEEIVYKLNEVIKKLNDLDNRVGG